ncbi:MAG: anthranilate synthase component I [Planctomycetota bacterium]|jgi:anthranilate synthase component 1
MIRPALDEFASLSKQGNLVPVHRTLMADCLTPVSAANRIFTGDYSFLYESVVGGEKIGRYSFLGADPVRVFRSSGTEVTLLDFDGTHLISETTLEHASPIDLLAEMMAEYEPVPLEGLPRFSGGGVGYVGYDVVRQVEDLPNTPPRGLNLPEIYFGFYHTMLIFDHVSRTVEVVAHADLRTDSPEVAYAAAVTEIDRIMGLLDASGPGLVEEVPEVPSEDPVFESNFVQADFEKAVEACQEYIRAGDIFQVVLSQRLKMHCPAPPFEVYRTLRTINPSPYMFYLSFPELHLVGSSPEVMVRVEDGVVTVRPIAGTRPRGRDAAEDAELAEDLLNDPKERAEHTMLVDLGRNDVGRVAEYGKVELTDCMVIENYSHVMHIVSNVEGTLKKGMTAFDTLKACLPAGTLSGAPKVRAMEIIDEFEPDVRGPYGGAVGYVDFNGNMDTCIAIRTILLQGEDAYVQAGAGIVLDSVPAKEYEETRSKARAMLRAIAATGRE